MIHAYARHTYGFSFFLLYITLQTNRRKSNEIIIIIVEFPNSANIKTVHYYSKQNTQ